MNAARLVVVAMIALGSFAAGFVASPYVHLGSATEPDVRRVDLDDLDAVVTGTVDSAGVAWIVARHRDSDALRLYRIGPDGSTRRTALAIPSAGAQAGVVVGPLGMLWIGAGDVIARVDPDTGRATRVVHLPPAAESVASAQRAPDGTVLGRGNVVGLAVDEAGSAWVSRYAVPALTRIDALTYGVSTVSLPSDVDAAAFAVTAGRIWFTTNFGRSPRLGAYVGELDPTLRTVRLHELAAAVLVANGGLLEAIGASRAQLQPATRQASQARLPREPLSLGAVAADGQGRLIARVAKLNRLVRFDGHGRVDRTIDFDAGSFATRGRSVDTVAPLAFMAAPADGSTWFAARGGNSVYRAR